MGERAGLSVERIVDAATAVADRGGVAGVSMRSIGRELGVEAMSLYHHVAGKEQLLDRLVDRVFSAIEEPRPDDAWRPGMERRARSVRRALGAHPWALGLLESRRAPGPALLRHHDAVIGCLRRGGFSIALAAHAYSVIDAYVFGFVLTEQNLPFEAGEGASEFARDLALPADEYPHLVEMVGALIADGDYAYGDEFEVGLGIVLDQLAHRLAAGPAAATPPASAESALTPSAVSMPGPDRPAPDAAS